MLVGKDSRKQRFGPESIRFSRIFFRFCISPGVDCGVPFIFGSGRHEDTPKRSYGSGKNKSGEFTEWFWNVLVHVL